MRISWLIGSATKHEFKLNSSFDIKLNCKG